MEQIAILLEKIELFELQKSDLDEFIVSLESQIKEAKGPLIVILKDSLEWIRAIALLLEKYEKGEFGIVGDDWREGKIEFEKLKRIIDEMDYDGIFAHKIWALGGTCYLDVIDKSNFLQNLYDRLEAILTKLSQIIDKLGLKLKKAKITKEETKKLVMEEDIMELVEERPKKEIPLIKGGEGEDKGKIERKPKKIMAFTKDKEVDYGDQKIFNTNLKHIEKELEFTFKKLQKFNKSQDEIEKWVSQFKTHKHRIWALKLLNNVRYYNDEDIIELYTLAHKNLLREFEENPNINQFLFVPAGFNPGSSGSRCTPDYRMYNNLSESQILNASELGKIENNKFKYTVFVDDFIGTGKQASDFLSKIKFDDLKSKGIEKFFFVVWMGFDEGISKIEEKYNEVKVIYAELLKKQDKAFSEESTIFSNEEKEEAKKIFEEYGKKLFKDFPLGYADFAALISFKTKSPNHTLPIIWSDARGWSPIFRKF